MLSVEEFVTIAVHLKRLDNDELLTLAFKQFDKNHSGFIEFEELRESLLDEHLGPNNDQVVKDIIFDADLDNVSLTFIHYIDSVLIMVTAFLFRLSILKWSFY